MMKTSALDIPTSKIAEVDIALEEDSFSAHERSLQLPTVKTEQSKFGQICEDRLSISGEYNNFQEKTLSGHHVHSASVSLGGRMETQQMSSSRNELTIEQVSQYFQNNSKILSSTEEQCLDCVQSISEKIKSRIEEGLLKVSRHQKHLQYNKPPKRVDQEKLRQNLIYKRQEIIEQLKQISQEEINLRSNKKSLNHRDKEKCEITEQDKRKLVQLIKAKKEFELSLKKKNDQLLQDSKKARAEEQARLKKEYETANLSKKDKILNHLKQIEIKSKEREEKLKHSVLRNVSRYSYKKNEKQWKRSLSVHELEIKKKIEQIKEKHNLKIEQINDHEKKYSLQLENRVLAQSQVKLISQSLPKRKKTHFDRIIEEELFQLKQRHKEQALKIFQRDYRQKIVRFQQKIDQDYKPTVDPTKTKVKHIEKAYSSISLSKEERIEKGLEYLTKAKQMKKNIILSVNPETTENSKISKVHSEEATGYKNYLKQNVPYNPLKRELSEILSEKEQKRSFQSLLRAKYLTEGLQAKAKKGGDNQIYSSMKSKLKLLSNLY